MNNLMRQYGAATAYGSDVALSVYGALMKVYQIAHAMFVGVSSATQPINGYNFGARQYSRVRETYRLASAIALGISVGWFAVYQIFPRQIGSLFVSGDASYLDACAVIFRLYMLGFFQVKRMIFDLQHPVLAHGLENIGQVLQCRRYILDKNTIADTLVLMNHITGRETVQQPTGDIVLDQFCLIFDIVFVGRLVTSNVCRKTPRRLPYACGRPATGLACLRTCCCAANGG